METTEKIVESYCRHVKGWFTIPNIKCTGQYEIDLLAIETHRDGTVRRYHIESGVSISGGYSKLTAKPYSPDDLKIRVKQAGQRRTLGYFRERKFGAPEIMKELRGRGFKKSNYTRIIVTWGWTDEAKQQADKDGIELWDFRAIMHQIADSCRDGKTYFTDDTLRTIQLFSRSGVVTAD